MIKRIGALLVVIGMFAGSTSALAVFDAELRYGKRWYETESDGEKTGIAYAGPTLAAHVGFMPIVSFGAYLASYDIVAADKDNYELSSANLLELGIDILAEIPLIPIITPFGRVQLPLSSTGTIKGEGYESTGNTAHIGDFIVTAGVEYSPIPLLGITFEIGQGTVMSNTEEEKIGGEKQDLEGHDKDKKASSVATAMLGVNVGF